VNKNHPHAGPRGAEAPVGERAGEATVAVPLRGGALGTMAPVPDARARPLKCIRRPRALIASAPVPGGRCLTAPVAAARSLLRSSIPRRAAWRLGRGRIGPVRQKCAEISGDIVRAGRVPEYACRAALERCFVRLAARVPGLGDARTSGRQYPASEGRGGPRQPLRGSAGRGQPFQSPPLRPTRQTRLTPTRIRRV
jgi:hypothetical protein